MTRQALCLQPLVQQVDGPADCTAGIFLEPAWDPVRRQATYRQSPNVAPLAAGTTYVLTPYVAIAPDAAGFRTFEGTPLARPRSFAFGVRDASAPYDTISTAERYCASPRPTCLSDCQASCAASCADDACEHACLGPCVAACPRSVAGILGKSGCSVSSCHRGDTAPAGLDMSSPALLASAIGRVAHGSMTGEHAQTPEEAPGRFGRAMPLIDPGVPGNSWLVYKLLANPDLLLSLPFPDPTEPARVQRTIISGMPMPPSNGFGAKLRAGEAEWLSEWILQGAPVKVCP